MIFRTAPVIQEVVHLINRSSTYINKYGKHPDVKTGICTNQIRINESNPQELEDNEWMLSKEDIKNDDLYQKMKEQIIIIGAYEKSVWILS